MHLPRPEQPEGQRRELNLIAGAYARIAVEPAAVRVMCVWMSGDE